ncbi:phosphate ABC transporter ATP-binding protein [Thermohalobacter berrensis]|uniref:ABC transporter n=1 Tax=Thermohalobacter berrensis TaxID=99594 RepID=A0A419T255_9FIRM|nr:phosphate ABC transporter ATP-binding protein [Thermohalobacter berrensis]RKD31644.1 ABC transporter [Thermohalobacter berrensis]
MEIKIKNLKKYYNDKLVLKIEELHIEKRKITGIIGPNGAGKTTLLRIISGLDEDFSGRITYDNSTLNNNIYDNMTLVFQKPYLFRRSVYDNIAYPLKIRKKNKAEIDKRVSEMLNRLQIYNLKNEKAHLLSGGESQKVALARALIFKPKLVMLDEPTSNIDPESIKTIEKEIKNYNSNEKATIIIITHNLEQAKRLCDNTIYLENGRVNRINGFL